MLGKVFNPIPSITNVENYLVLLAVLILLVLPPALASASTSDEFGVNLTIVDANLTSSSSSSSSSSIIATTTLAPAGPGGGGGAAAPVPKFMLDLMVSNKRYSPSFLTFEIRISNKGTKAGDVKVRYTLTSAGQSISETEQLFLVSSSSCALMECPHLVDLRIPSDFCSRPSVILNVSVFDVTNPGFTYAEVLESACIELTECTTNQQCPVNEVCVDNKCFTSPESIPSVSPLWGEPAGISYCWPSFIILLVVILAVVVYLYLKRRKTKKEEEGEEKEEKEEPEEEPTPQTIFSDKSTTTTFSSKHNLRRRD